ncbi:hypothetical protein HNY73_005815 [Argiope bruennichi]|uniref:Uncharacterized protein n=1 Tax=Argiope bruennichi TaxID=94029 RepID=A0A8T0FK92_ARGBR|nr:hypothetical protein HNY73_005815 [Argiope bruennichi]
MIFTKKTVIRVECVETSVTREYGCFNNKCIPSTSCISIHLRLVDLLSRPSWRETNPESVHPKRSHSNRGRAAPSGDVGGRRSSKVLPAATKGWSRCLHDGWGSQVAKNKYLKNQWIAKYP